MLIETNCRHKKKPPVLRSRHGKIRSWLRRKRRELQLLSSEGGSSMNSSEKTKRSRSVTG